LAAKVAATTKVLCVIREKMSKQHSRKSWKNGIE